jgi:hypothetical protein
VVKGEDENKDEDNVEGESVVAKEEMLAGGEMPSPLVEDKMVDREMPSPPVKIKMEKMASPAQPSPPVRVKLEKAEVKRATTIFLSDDDEDDEL